MKPAIPFRKHHVVLVCTPPPIKYYTVRQSRLWSLERASWFQLGPVTTVPSTRKVVAETKRSVMYRLLTIDQS